MFTAPGAPEAALGDKGGHSKAAQGEETTENATCSTSPANSLMMFTVLGLQKLALRVHGKRGVIFKAF